MNNREIFRTCDALSSKRWAPKVGAVKRLQRLGAVSHPAVLPRLLTEVFGGTDLKVRGTVVAAIGPLAGYAEVRRTLLWLVRLAGDEEATLRRMAVQFLAPQVSLSSGVLGELIQVAENDADESVREAAIEAIVPEGDRWQVLDLLVKTAGETSSQRVQHAAILGLLHWLPLRRGLADVLLGLRIADRSLGAYARKCALAA